MTVNLLTSACYALAHDVDDEDAAAHYASRGDATTAQLMLLLDAAADVPPVLELPGRCLMVVCDRCRAPLGGEPGMHLTVEEVPYELADSGRMTFAGQHVCSTCVPVMLALLVYGPDGLTHVPVWPLGGARCP